MEERQQSSASAHTWMGLGLWVAMLAALLITSMHAVSAVTTGGYLWQVWSQLAPSQYTDVSAQAVSPTAVAMVLAGSALTLVVVVLIGSAWLKFATLSHSVIVSYAWLEQKAEESSIFLDLLNFRETGDEGAEEEADLDLDKAEGTLVGDIVRYLAFAWAVLLLIPPAIVAVAALL